MTSSRVFDNIRLVVFDLDGTLLDHEGKIGAASKTAISQLQDAGVQFTFASGRHFHAVSPYAETIGMSLPFIAFDGALIQNVSAKICIHCSSIPEKTVSRIVRLAGKYLLDICLVGDTAAYCLPHQIIVSEFVDIIGGHYRKINSFAAVQNRALELVIAGENLNALKIIQKKTVFPWAFGLQSRIYPSSRHTGIHCLSIKKGGADKAKGLRKLQRHLGISMTETVVTGDWYNDQEMFETNAYKVAVANAVQPIRIRADFITSHTNNEDGLAEFLDVLLAAKRSVANDRK
jgi:Cof subfamily protein (haloacid dehalogenase superfamily)